MKIAVDARFVGKSGIGTYIENVLDCFLKEHPEHSYLVITDQNGRYQESSNIDVQYCEITPFSKKELLNFPLERVNKCDAFYSPYINLPLGIKVPVFSTIHDVIFLDYPGLVSSLGKYVRWMFFWYAVHKSKTIFTVSNFSKSRIQYHFGKKKRIAVTYSAISNQIKRYEGLVAEKEDYYIYVGNVKKHKGLKVLIEAFKQAKKEGLASKLFIVGDNAKFRSNDESFNEALNSCDDVVFTGFIPNEKMFEMIGRAKALILPSFYEGLGLPPMEALYLGTNAIVSDIDVFKEIYESLPVRFFKTGCVDSLKKILLEFKTMPFDVVEIRGKIDKTYNFSTIAESILTEIRRSLA